MYQQNCCMCYNEILENNGLIPNICLKINGEKSHRICHTCWWDHLKGFARESASHKCPGCINNYQLTCIPSIESKIGIIDLTI